MKGDFSIKTDETKYRRYLDKYQTLAAKLKKLDQTAETLDPKALRRYQNIKGAALHNMADETAVLRLNAYSN